MAEAPAPAAPLPDPGDAPNGASPTNPAGVPAGVPAGIPTGIPTGILPPGTPPEPPPGTPRVTPWQRLLRFSRLYREAQLLRWNVKVIGTTLAQLQAQAAPWTMADLPERPVLRGLSSRVCRQSDIEAPWLRHWCRVLHTAPLYHRKLWEDAFALQTLWEAGMLAPGRRGLGFAVGREGLPAVLASHGAEVLATDLPAADARAQVWIGSNQHVAAPGSPAGALFHPQLIDRADFDARVGWRDVDMRRIPADLAGGFDFLWSVCAFEHLGSLENGLDFVVQAMRCLKPGGIAVHTTEFNLDDLGGTVDRGPTVLYQRRHFTALAERLAALGHQLLPIEEVGPGEAGVLDNYVDLPPFAEAPGPLGALFAPHLRLAYRGYPVTSAGLLIRAGAAA